MSGGAASRGRFLEERGEAQMQSRRGSRKGLWLTIPKSKDYFRPRRRCSRATADGVALARAKNQRDKKRKRDVQEVNNGSARAPTRLVPRI